MRPSRRDNRTAARERLVAGFLASLPEELQSLVALAGEVVDEEDWEGVSYTLERLGSTAASLNLDHIAKAAEEAVANLGKVANEAAFAPLVHAIRKASPVGTFGPIAVVGEKQGRSIELQDDGTCEPIQRFSTVDDLVHRVVEWPQAIVLPASDAARVGELKRTFGCSVYVYGPARDRDARMLAGREGATGYVAEPVVLDELLSAIRYRNSLPKRPAEVALLGAMEWSAPLLAGLHEDGFRCSGFTEVDRVGAVLHSLLPDVVVLGPMEPRQLEIVVRMVRGHVGRSHVAILTVGNPDAVVTLGVEANVDTFDVKTIGKAIRTLIDRMADHQRDRDVLTQLPNRAGILSSAQRAFAFSERHGEPMSVALVRAHGLERASHEHGTEAANACRRHLAITLERGLRRLDEVGYLGEDLFCCLLYHTRADEVLPRMQQLCESFIQRARADRRLRHVQINLAVVDTTAGVRGLLPRALRKL